MAAPVQAEEETAVIGIHVMWLDANAYTNESKNDLKKLCKNFGRCKVVDSTNACETAIKHSFDGIQYVAIVSGQLGETFVRSYKDNQKFSSIYVYCQNVGKHKEWAQQYGERVNYVTNNIDELISKIREKYSSS